ncbi:MAG: hypothetical protein NZ455_02085 [Bacteroidia bacterium]|nr:hypothetical protein [Bacteroidia bacterium]
MFRKYCMYGRVLVGVSLALMPTRSACYGLTVLRPTRPPPRQG